MKATIHQTYRIQYLKDTVLPRMLDDGTFSTINTFVILSQNEIVQSLYKDKTFLKQLYVAGYCGPVSLPHV